MNPLKHFVRHTLHAVHLFLVVWSATDEEVDEWEAEDEEGDMERDAAYLTTGLLTATRLIHAAHDEGENCTPHHEAAADLIVSIDHPLIAVRVIQHLLDITSQVVDEEDVQQMVANIVATELSDEEDDPRHHH